MTGVLAYHLQLFYNYNGNCNPTYHQLVNNGIFLQ